MSQPYDAQNMDRPLQRSAGSVRRARERAQQGLPREQGYDAQELMQDPPPGGLSPPPSRRGPGPFAPPQHAYKPRVAPPIEGRAGQPISRPTQIPQWPLPSSPQSPARALGQPAPRPPPGRPQQAPQRPPRPSVVPSLVNQARLQEPTPLFYTSHHQDDDESAAEFQSPTADQRLTTSSVGSIPDFPEPGVSQTAAAASVPRRSANLGPPPSSRRGASSFYSHASYVSPIPEESPRSRSHISGASSGVIPDGRRGTSPGLSPGYNDAFFDDSITDRESMYDDFGDESRLVRSASIGKKGKPALVVTRAPGAGSTPRIPQTSALPFHGGTGLKDGETSSSGEPSSANNSPEATPGEERQVATPEAMLDAYAAASAGGPHTLRKLTPSPKPPSRLSGLKKPPRLDMDAVREMEARGSTTSLSDLIRRATRLAAMMERGKRPASRFDNLNDFLDRSIGSRDGEKDAADEKHQSGLSDMLAAFPPPAQDGRQPRGSWFRTTSWPLAPGRPGQQPQRGIEGLDGASEGKKTGKKGRRCCGMPLWLFAVVFLLLLCALAAAIVVPLEFFVFKNLGSQAKTQSSLDQCRSDLKCQNGGTNVVMQGDCSCICTSGFVGKECEIGGTVGCTTTNLVSSNGETTVRNVTLGRSVPRIIAHSMDNFTVPLSGTAILAKFSSTNLSCIAQNALVTFDGQSARLGEPTVKVQSIAAVKNDVGINMALQAEEPETITALTEPAPAITAAPTLHARGESSEEKTGTTEKLIVDPSATAGPTPTSSGKKPASTSTEDDGRFKATEEVLDFARVVVLYILQEQEPSDAEDAQSEIQKFFDQASETDKGGATTDDAEKLRVADEVTIDLINFTIKIGGRTVGGRNETETSTRKRSETPLPGIPAALSQPPLSRIRGRAPS